MTLNRGFVSLSLIQLPVEFTEKITWTQIKSAVLTRTDSVSGS